MGESGWNRGEIVGQHTTINVFSLPFALQEIPLGDKGRAGVGMD